MCTLNLLDDIIEEAGSLLASLHHEVKLVVYKTADVNQYFKVSRHDQLFGHL